MSAIKQAHVEPAEHQIVQFPGHTPARSVASSPEVKEDLRLVKQIAAGDQQAVAALYQQRGTLLYSLLLRMLGDEMEAQEVMQDTFVRILLVDHDEAVVVLQYKIGIV